MLDLQTPGSCGGHQDTATSRVHCVGLPAPAERRAAAARPAIQRVGS